MSNSPKKKGPSAFDRATRILSGRDHSRYQLECKLKQRGHSWSEIKDTLTKLEDLKYLDDLRFARALLREQVTRRGRGFAAAKLKLREAGISAEEINIVVEESTEEIDEKAVCRREAKKKLATMPDLPTKKKRERLMRFLNGRGFPAWLIRDVIDSVFDVFNDEEIE